jgi:hypothetical protein
VVVQWASLTADAKRKKTMVTHGASYKAPPPQLEMEELWRELYPKLYALARYIVYQFRVVSWCGGGGYDR